MDPVSIGLGIGKLVLGGLFSRNAERRQRANEIDDQINGPSRMREGAVRAGLSPLTLLGASSFNYGGVGGGGGAPALASQQLVNSVFNTFEDGMARQQEKELAEKEHSLEQQRIDLLKARSGGAGGIVQRTGFVTAKKEDGVESDPLAPGRDIKRDPVTDTPFITRIDNVGTGGPIRVPGADGEIAGIDEVLTGVVVGGPQVLYNWGKKAFDRYPTLGPAYRDVVKNARENPDWWRDEAESADHAPKTYHIPKIVTPYYGPRQQPNTGPR